MLDSDDNRVFSWANLNGSGNVTISVSFKPFQLENEFIVSKDLFNEDKDLKCSNYTV